MTNQEAIKWIDGRVLELACLVDITSSDRRMQRINEEYNALLLARTAIYKQIPMQPELKIEHNDELWRKELYVCQICGEILCIQHYLARPDGVFSRYHLGSRTTACPSCGQVLKWKDDNHV